MGRAALQHCPSERASLCRCSYRGGGFMQGAGGFCLLVIHLAGHADFASLVKASSCCDECCRLRYMMSEWMDASFHTPVLFSPRLFL